MKKKIKIVYITPHPLTARWLNTYCLDELYNKYDIEYWVASELLDIKFNTEQGIPRPWVKHVHTLHELNQCIIKLPTDTLIVCCFGFTDVDSKIIKVITSKFNNLIWIDIWSTGAKNTLNNLQKDESIISKKEQYTFYKKIKDFFYRSIFVRRCFKTIAAIMRNKHKVSLMFVIQEWRSIKRNDWRHRNALEITNLFNPIIISTVVGSKYYINHTDYEKYLSLTNVSSLYSSPYIVYVDSGFPVLEDFSQYMNKLEKKFISNMFYSSIRRFFDKIEKQYQCEVIIASHPGAKHEEGIFGNRKILSYKTAELIKDCEFAISFGGCAMSYVALWDKPFVLITNKAIRKIHAHREITENYAAAFQVELCDTDACEDVSKYVMRMNDDIRKIYIKKTFDTSIQTPNSILYEQIFEDIHKRMNIP